MTHTTEQEQQLHQLLELVLTELDRKAIPVAYMQEIDRKGKAFIEQAARRAPAVPVQQGWTDQLEQVLCDLQVGPYPSIALAVKRIEGLLAAAPQPPEADHIPDAGKMVAAPMQIPENIREGEPYDNPAFEALARALGVWGTAQSAVCAQFWIAAKEQST